MNYRSETVKNIWKVIVNNYNLRLNKRDDSCESLHHTWFSDLNDD